MPLARGPVSHIPDSLQITGLHNKENDFVTDHYPTIIMPEISPPLFVDETVSAIAAKDIVLRTSCWTGPGRLLLPPIQRSLVWRNSQIVNYWDSLLRGYPAGLMMVHRSRASGSGNSQARNSDGKTCKSNAGDFQIFDGQQRLSTLLLGHGYGQLSRKLRLWVDLGTEPDPVSGLLFQLRISSSGQPFGYRAASPNQKFSLSERRSKIDAWRNSRGLTSFDPREAFEAVEGRDLIGEGYPIRLAEAVELVNSVGLGDSRKTLLLNHSGIPEEPLSEFLAALDRALKLPILFQLINEAVLAEESEYIRFFGRLGQGGTALSQDELTYSIIKHNYPEVHDRMNEIVNGDVGRLVSEVHLVLGAIRVAKLRSDWRPTNPWEVIGRPTPDFVSKLKELPGVEVAFREMIPATAGGRLLKLLEEVRKRLVYHQSENPGGLPVMLLARMPPSLVDVLLLLADLPKENNGDDPLPAFALYWLLFVSGDDNAASYVYRQFLEDPPVELARAIPSWINQFERDGVAYTIPLLSQVKGQYEKVHNGDHRLRAWSERFTGLDADAERPSGDTLRTLSTNSELIKRALLWLQRKQLSNTYSHFDPTSTEDEDLPIDLDHRIPGSIFGFHWKSRDSFIEFEDPDDNFRNFRGLIGNSLGNLRWLDASENRSRGNGILEPDLVFNDIDVEPWNQLIRKRPWNLKDVETFQRLVDHRTLDLCSTVLEEGGIYRLKTGIQK